MSDELRDRLRRLGVAKGMRHLKPAVSPPERSPSHPSASPAGGSEQGEAAPVERVMPGGRLLENDHGRCFIVERVYPLTHEHGRRRLVDLLSHPPEIAARLGRDERLAVLDFSQLLFLDTETTGLSGAGTLAFMVGVGFFDGEALVVRQYFLRDQADEGAMLRDLAGLLRLRPGVVTFNGRSFDIPLLDNRFFLNRVDPHLGDLRDQPNFDLLLPARRLWRWQWASCALSALEVNVLDVRRTGEDVPGSLIPWLYSQYLRSGNAAPLRGVFYHNHVDILSMVTLAAEMLAVVQEPDRPLRPLERLGVARWHLDEGAPDRAEAELRLGLGEGDVGPDRDRLLAELAALLKRTDRRQEALSCWQELAQEYDSLEAHVELAKYYEWHEPDLEQALFWTARGLQMAEADPAGRLQLPDLHHRLARIDRKRKDSR